MKRTKSMIIHETDESRELFLYAVNNGVLYSRAIVPTIRNLAKKYRAGKFDAEKAIDAFYYVSTMASEMYNRDFGYKFTVTERFTAAASMRDYFMEDIETECA